MQINHEIITTPPVDAASVLLVRDSEAGMQVLLLRRHQSSQVLGGAYVFPGGKLDAADHAAQSLPLLSETPEHLRQRLHEPGLDSALAAGLFMAALREAFEECGVLVGQVRPDPALLQLLRNAGWHHSLHRQATVLDTTGLLPWSRWITPRQPAVTNKRFDTRFFLVHSDSAQQARHDDVETTDSVWLTPQQALERYARGDIDLVAPQIMSLYQLKGHASVASALEEARQQKPALVEPHPFDENGLRILCYPGDPKHPVQERCMRGPTRLSLQQGRFVPLGGMAELLD